LKISVQNQENDDEGFGSQDKDDCVFGDNEISQFEKSLEQFEVEFKENQQALKSLHKKVSSTAGKKCKKVSDFFKVKPDNKNVLSDLTNEKAVKDESKNLTCKETSEKSHSDTEEKTRGKRGNPFTTKYVFYIYRFLISTRKCRSTIGINYNFIQDCGFSKNG